MGFVSSKQIDTSKCLICRKTPKQQFTSLPCQCMFICKTHYTDLICERINLKASIKCKKCKKVYELSRTGFGCVCAYCERILKEPYFLPCKCTNICKEHLKSQDSNTNFVTCIKCDQTYDLKVLSKQKNLTSNQQLSYFLDKHTFLNENEILLKKNCEYDLNELDATQIKLNAIVSQFSLTQAEHFANVRNQIDIERETLLKEIYSIDNELHNIDYIQKQSALMIWQVDKAEQAYRDIFNEKMKFIAVNIREEREKLDCYFRSPKMDLNKLLDWQETILKAKLDYLNFKFVEFKKLESDLKLNKFEPANLSPSTSIHLHLGTLHLFKFFYPSNLAIYYDATNDVIIYDPNKSLIEKRLVGHMNEVTCVISFGTRKLISASKDFCIKIWDLDKSQCVQTLRGHTKRINCLKLLENQKTKSLLASGSNDYSIRIWDLDEGQCLFSLLSKKGSVTSLDQDMSGLLMGSFFTESICIWNLTSRQCVSTFSHSELAELATNVKFLPFKNLFASAYLFKITIWDYKAGRMLRSLEEHDDYVNCLEANLDHLISCSRDMNIFVWDLITFKCIYKLNGHGSNVTSVRFDWISKCLLSCSTNGKIKIWNLEKGECLMTVNFDVYGLNIDNIGVLSLNTTKF